MEESIYVPSTKEGTSAMLVGSCDERGVEVFFFPDEDEKSKKKMQDQIRKLDSHKRRCASEDSISIDSSSFRDEDEVYVRACPEAAEDSITINTEMRELLDFETSVMGIKNTDEPPEEFVEPLPQVKMELGDITQFEIPSTSSKNDSTRKSSDSDEDFCFVVEEERPSYSQAEVPMSDDPIRIVDNHFSLPIGKPDLLKAPKDFPMAVQVSF